MKTKLLLVNGKFVQLNYFLLKGDIIEMPYGISLFLLKHNYLQKEMKTASFFAKKMYLALNRKTITTPIQRSLKYSKYFFLVFNLDFCICYMAGLNVFYVCDDEKRLYEHIEYKLLARTVFSLYN
jgi:hypothetical protein